jgi:hypothetical protein
MTDELPKPLKYEEIPEVPHVEIYLLCCKEPLEIIQGTLDKLVLLDYPHDKFQITI